MKYDLIIFDWDGTLADSTGRIVDSMQRCELEHHPSANLALGLHLEVC